MRTASFLALALVLALVLDSRDATAQPPKAPVFKPTEIYDKLRTTIDEGKFDVTGIYLDEFLKSNPPDADLLEIERKYGTTTFQALRTIPKYSDDPATEKKIRANIEELNKRAQAAAGKLLYTKERVNKYIANLGKTPEEKEFAQLELKRTGDYAIPYLIEAIRTNPDPDLYSGIIETIPVLEAPTMAGWVAALDGLPADRQYGILSAMAKRRDALNLLQNAQTDFTPNLWRILSGPRSASPTLYDLAEQLVNKVVPGAKADTKRPEAELTALARKFYDRKARFLGVRNNSDGSSPRVPVWVTVDRGGLISITRLDVPVSQAEEYYGLRYARWVLDTKPDYEPAQALILALASERAVERARGGNLAVTEPTAYKLLADAPSSLLTELLTRGLNEKRTALVLATVQALGDRADREAATPPAGTAGKPSLLVRALSYPDHAVQFAAATALLRSPVPVPASAKPAIVEALRRAAATDSGKVGSAKGTVLLADPSKFRGDANASILYGMGYDVEQFTSGRDLLRRVARASDFDLIFIDRHTPNPELIDLISQLTSDTRTAARPVFVIASSDKPKAPTFDQLLVRTGAIIAATGNATISLPPAYIPDPQHSPDEQNRRLQEVQRAREQVVYRAAAERAQRLHRIVDTLSLTLNENQKLLLDLRIQLMTYSILAAEIPVWAGAIPEITVAASQIAAAEIARLQKQIALQPASAAYGTAVASSDLMKLLERFEPDVAKNKASQDRYDFIRSHVDPEELGITIETFRDQAAEARLTRMFKSYPEVKIIPEPYSKLGLESEFKTLYADPMMIPRDPAVKKADARTAIEFIRLMAIGDLPGYELKTTEGELRDAVVLNPDPDIASTAIDALERFKSAAAQQAILQLATKKIGAPPVSLRRKAADAVIRHIRANGKAVTPELVNEVVEQSTPEATPDAELRAKFLTLKGMLAFKAGDFTSQLKGYSPPIVPPEPKKEAEKKEPEQKEPEKKEPEQKDPPPPE
ncbi:transcriptional regulator : HEAT repeat-containing protein OS=Singulisphaera acidiphila (strain ATCC BAA-1392 / DSM 18658 / VKM B-2454 / MOB10) GN=Sinac_0176 PE=4 SV=1: Response_reg [Gemmata massiliana]|uniref:Response regulatory domain-containing protein n=1 Tax=Gemmata massiliana TaxID=1210884 RepID=A0A6P2DCC3_9BACT|nr:hypothetical protein [Gemmata massiliana]VTR98005.1 transcriptional regulator : HEAT repeat-containing protein OS=Singulisphaera acidiphila (strain ATCC BAA-1392 / DSM 18658 / VKM B-2454 / MOB10) GN=Sinac_0176 PE=4 SV=1: Response_reg [Gemmata massiliana]